METNPNQNPAPAQNPVTIHMEPELISPVQLLKNAWAVYSQHLTQYLFISIIPTLAFAVLGGLFGGGGYIAYRLGVNKGLLMGSGVVIGLVVLVICIYIGLWGAVALLTAIKNREQGVNFKQAFTASRPLIGAFFVTSALSGLAVMGGILLLIIPGIIFAIWFSQASYIVVSEHLQGSVALKRSKAYVVGRMGAVFWRGLFLMIIVWVVLGILALIVGKSAADIINPIAQVLVAPLISIYGFLLYENLRQTRRI
jgi:hypothetical protein